MNYTFYGCASITGSKRRKINDKHQNKYRIMNAHLALWHIILPKKIPKIFRSGRIFHKNLD